MASVRRSVSLSAVKLSFCLQPVLDVMAILAAPCEGQVVTMVAKGFEAM